MTGYSRASAESDAYEAVVEIRSVNHRYLDVRVRVPSGLGTLEKRVRDRVAGEMARGKVDVNLHLKPIGESAYELEVDRPLIGELVETLRELSRESGLEGELRPSDLASFSPAFKVKDRDLSSRSGLDAALGPALDSALEQHRRMRDAEGAELAADLTTRVETMADHLDRVESLSAASRERKHSELIAKIEELSLPGVEPNALAMEVARLVEKSDITEELTRFRSHLELWRDAVGASGPCGKKLDFIVQEMNREANTIGSKCQDAGITEQVIAVKSELERVREQVQNVE